MTVPVAERSLRFSPESRFPPASPHSSRSSKQIVHAQSPLPEDDQSFLRTLCLKQNKKNHCLFYNATRRSTNCAQDVRSTSMSEIPPFHSPTCFPRPVHAFIANPEIPKQDVITVYFNILLKPFKEYMEVFSVVHCRHFHSPIVGAHPSPPCLHVSLCTT